ncbi:hypothetical protein M422DRAFT_252555, partial [Sphaerobolus stellatus SS14]
MPVRASLVGRSDGECESNSLPALSSEYLSVCETNLTLSQSKRHSRTPSAPRIDSPPRHTPPPQQPVPAPSPPNPTKPVQAPVPVPVIETPRDDLSPPPPPPPAAPAPTPTLPPTSATNGHTPSESTPSSPSTSARTLTPPPPQSQQLSQPIPPPLSSRTSTFKRIPPRTRTSSAPHSPSPLRPDYVPKSSTESIHRSPSISRQTTFRRLDSSAPQTPNASAKPLMSSPLARPPAHFASPKPVLAVPHSALPVSPSPSPSATPAAVSPVTSPPISTHSRIPSTSLPQSPSPTPRRSAAPYRPGFQAKGVYRPRTDEFLAARNSQREQGKIEERRLERRLEK